MSSFRITTPQGTIRLTQNKGDLKAGLERGDLSRISAYSGLKGCHTGAASPTVGRNNTIFITNPK